MILLDILEEHLEELDFLLNQRIKAMRSSGYNSLDLFEIEERIEAHLQGLIIGKSAIHSMMEEGLSANNPTLVFAAAYALLRINTEVSSQQVWNAFKEGSGPQFVGIREALCHGPIDNLVQQLQEIFIGGSPLQASAAGEVLAFHKELNPNNLRLHEFFSDEDPEVRQAGWRILALLA